MKYPALMIDQLKFRENAEILLKLLTEKGLRFHAVTKCVTAWEPLVKILAESGIRYLADSRLQNFETLNKYANSTLLLRLPMISEAREVVRLCDMSLNSEWDTLCALSDAALAQNRRHGVILMLELGDRREGVMPEDADALIHRVMNLRGVRLLGLGANFNCYGGVIPDVKKLRTLAEMARRTEERYHIELDYVSGGNSGSLYLLHEADFPEGINHLRIGEALLLGRETSYGHRFAGLHQDVFTLRAEVIECKRKPSLPDGLLGLNAAGEAQSFVDEGIIRRVILALGGQDTIFSGLTPQMKNLRYLGNSSDHSIFNVSEVHRELRVGDCLDFSLNYVALTAAFTSKYVQKALV